MKTWKILNGLESCHGGKHTWQVGEWVEVRGELIACHHGIHLCREQGLLHWLNRDIYEAEYDSEYIECDDKIVVRRARITKHLSSWNDRTARLFSCDCAEDVVHLLPDDRSINALKIARLFANGQAKENELDAARDAAWAAAREAADGAAWAAAWAAAWEAAWAAARDTARNAARDAQTTRLMRVLYP